MQSNARLYIAGTDPARITALDLAVIQSGGKRGKRPALWDRQAAVRIESALAERLTA